jgi:hypothetical protein
MKEGQASANPPAAQEEDPRADFPFTEAEGTTNNPSAARGESRVP